MQSYFQVKAMLAITKASLRSIFRSPSAVIFSIAFPLIFILVFGFLSSGGNISVKVAMDPRSDTANYIYSALQRIPSLKLAAPGQQDIDTELAKGRITAFIHIEATGDTTQPYLINLTSSEAANPQNIEVLKSILGSVISRVNDSSFKDRPTYAKVNNIVKKVPGRVYRTIDFILPGQLGFSLLSAGVFGVAFLFFNLRQQLVLKRFYATPIRRLYIILGEALSRVIFQLITAIIIISIGHFAFQFTLVNGWWTFLDIMILSFIALILFMGFGFVVSGLAKNESTIPPFANLITLPQFLLAGTFFSIENFPKWMQPFCNILPLTHFNNAMRNISFEGTSLLATWPDIAVLLVWIVIVYALAFKIFKWE